MRELDCRWPQDNNEYVEVLTVLAAITLFGKSGQAIRLATRKGLVKTELVMDFDGKPKRLISLKSAEDYWGRYFYTDQQRKYFSNELEHMRMRSVIVHASGGKYYRLLHPWCLVEPAPTCGHGNDWRCNEPPCSPTWFQGDRGNGQ